LREHRRDDRMAAQRGKVGRREGILRGVPGWQRSPGSAPAGEPPPWNQPEDNDRHRIPAPSATGAEQ
jgi:hypothetical protein